MVIPGTPSGGPLGSNGVVFHDEYVSTEIGQIGTQFGGPGHVGVRTSKGDLFYNGREREATYTRGPDTRPVGMGDLGVEHVAEKAFVCRGVLLDDARPVGEIEGEVVPCHHVAQAHHGIWNIENLDFEPLLKEGVYEFVFVWSPLKIVGATGSPGNPVAIW